MGKHLLISLVVAACTASHIPTSSFGNAGDHIDYGSYDVHHFGKHYDSEHKAHGKDHYNYHVGGDASKKSYYGSSGDSRSHSSGGHHDEDSKKHSESSSDYGKDIKTKTYGYFDYRYIQPQYHIEKFHSEEKHASKYGDDAHSNGVKDYKDGGYYSKGNNDHYGNYGSKQAHYSDYKYGDSGHGYGEEDHYLGYGTHKGSYKEYGNSANGEDYARYYAPYHDDYHGQGQDHHFNNYHHGYEYY